jgi:hypothetical protein
VSEQELNEKLKKLMGLSKEIVGLTGEIAKDLADVARKEAAKTLEEIMAGIKKTMDTLSQKPDKPPG